MTPQERQKLSALVVSAEQMTQIESQLFARGMPVAALMEKAALSCASVIKQLYSPCQVGVLVGPGHNGGDALVVARELWLADYDVQIYSPFPKLKELTQQHADYARSLGIPFPPELEALETRELLIDGFFGFGLTRSLQGKIAQTLELVNAWDKEIVSIDIPSGLHTDTGEVLGMAVRATHTLCLGLWKRAFFQDQALEYLGKVQRVDFGIPPIVVQEVMAAYPSVQRLTEAIAQATLPLPRSLLTHKYQQGHLLLICGSARYAGSAILTALGARSSGVGMLSVAVPASLKPLLVSHLPEALVIACPETAAGAISALPALDLSSYSVIAAGPGLTREVQPLILDLLYSPTPLVLDADALNCLAELGIAYLANRDNLTVLTPHLGEFRWLFPEIVHPERDRLSSCQNAAQASNTIVLLKGARTVVATPAGTTWLVGESSPALARGGSGDVLTGLIGGWLAQNQQEAVVATAAWCHAQAALQVSQRRSELGVDGVTLAEAIFAICNKLFP